MRNISFRVLSLHVFFFVESLDPVGIRSRIIREFHLFTDADAFGLPVEISHVNRTADFLRDHVIACLPLLYGVACAFRCDCEMEGVDLFHFIDEAEKHCACAGPVHRDASHLAEEGSHRPMSSWTSSVTA